MFCCIIGLVGAFQIRRAVSYSKMNQTPFAVVDYEEKLNSVYTIHPSTARCCVFSGFRYKTHSTVTPFFMKSAVLLTLF